MATGRSKRIIEFSALLTALVGIAGVAKSIYDGLNQPSTVLPEPLQGYHLGGISLLVIGIAIGLRWEKFRARISQKSRLHNASAFNIRRNYRSSGIKSEKMSAVFA